MSMRKNEDFLLCLCLCLCFGFTLSYAIYRLNLPPHTLFSHHGSLRTRRARPPGMTRRTIVVIAAGNISKIIIPESPALAPRPRVPPRGRGRGRPLDRGRRQGIQVPVVLRFRRDLGIISLTNC